MKPPTISIRIREDDYDTLHETATIFEVNIVDAIEMVVRMWDTLTIEEQTAYMDDVKTPATSR